MTYHKYPNEWLPTIEFKDVQSGQGQYQLTKKIATHGYCIVRNCPTAKDSVQKVASCITPVIPSFYGNTFDVVSTENAINVAYTNVELPLHMDLVYMESAPGLQYLLCRQNDQSVTGGDSILVDGFAAAEDLRHKDPKAFEVLSTTLVRFQKKHYDRDFPVDLEWEQPHIVLGSNNEIIRFNWAPAFEGKSACHSYTADYLDAYRKLMQLIDESPTKMEKRLVPGECLIFNNRRMLHGRRTFELNGGVRHLEGCYTNLDEFRSRAQVLENTYGGGLLVQHVGNSNNI